MTIEPIRIQLSRRKGFDLQAVSLAANGLPAINVARPGPWGNPFVVGVHGDHGMCLNAYACLQRGFLSDWPGIVASPTYAALTACRQYLHELAARAARARSVPRGGADGDRATLGAGGSGVMDDKTLEHKIACVQPNHWSEREIIAELQRRLTASHQAIEALAKVARAADSWSVVIRDEDRSGARHERWLADADALGSAIVRALHEAMKDPLAATHLLKPTGRGTLV